MPLVLPDIYNICMKYWYIKVATFEVLVATFWGFGQHFSNFLALKRATFHDFASAICLGLADTKSKTEFRNPIYNAISQTSKKLNSPKRQENSFSFINNFIPSLANIAQIIYKHLHLVNTSLQLKELMPTINFVWWLLKLFVPSKTNSSKHFMITCFGLILIFQ